MKTHSILSRLHLGLQSHFPAALILFASFLCLSADAQPIVLTNIFSFTNATNNGAQPVANLVLSPAGTLYGTTVTGGTNNAGTVFKVNQDGSGFTLIHAFTFADTENGGTFNPSADNNSLPIVFGADRMLYGSSAFGGTNGDGMVYKMAPDGSGYTIIHSFGSSDDTVQCLIQGNDGALYGAGSALFRLTTDGTSYQVLHTLSISKQGIIPFSLLQASNGMLYGTTFTGGSNNSGAIFAATTNGSTFSVLRSLAAATDDPKGPTSLIQGSDGFIYGTSYGGGTNGDGSIFKFATDGSDFQVLYSFTGAPDGSQPFGPLLQSGNFLYGTTRNGGGGTGGTIFKIGLAGDSYGVLYNFPIIQGEPYAGLIQGSGQGNTSVLYGACAYAPGDPHDGVIFAMLLNPPVSITPLTGAAANGQKAIFWPAWAAGYVLQTTTNISTGTWTTVSNATPVLGLEVTNSLTTNYYRLIFP